MEDSSRYQIVPGGETELTPTPTNTAAAKGTLAAAARSAGNGNMEEQLASHQRCWSCFNTDNFGKVSTFNAMVPQGILGMLLPDRDYLQKVNAVGRGIVDGIVFSAATIGKYAIVRYYSLYDFLNLGTVIKRGYKTALGFYPEKAIDRTVGNFLFCLYNIPATIVMSGVFSGLAYVSFAGTHNSEGAADLVRQLGSTFLATLFLKRWFQLIFMIPAGYSNLLAFPNIHNSGFASLGNLAYADREAAKKIQFVHAYMQDRYAKNDHDALNDLDEALSVAKEATDGSLLLGGAKTKVSEVGFFDLGRQQQDAVTQYYDANHDTLNLNQFESKLVGTKGRYVRDFLKLAALFIGCAGLYNFRYMANITVGRWPHKVGPALNPVTQWIALSSMILMTLGTVPHGVEDFLNPIKPLNNLSKRSYGGRMIFVVIFALLGGAPNAYQSIIAGESISLTIAAWAASTLLEAPGLYALAMVEARLKEADAELEAVSGDIENGEGATTTKEETKGQRAGLYLDRALRRLSNTARADTNVVSRCFGASAA